MFLKLAITCMHECIFIQYVFSYPDRHRTLSFMYYLSTLIFEVLFAYMFPLQKQDQKSRVKSNKEISCTDCQVNNSQNPSTSKL